MIELKFKDDPVWLDKMWPWFYLAFQSSFAFQKSEIWKIAEIRRRSENLRFQLGFALWGGGQKIFIFKRGSFPYEGRVIFLGEVHTTLHTMWRSPQAL